MDKGAPGAFVRGLKAAGLDVAVDGTDVVVTPTAVFEPEDAERPHESAIEALDGPGVQILVSLGAQTRACYARETTLPTRLWVETNPADPFSVPAVPGDKLSVRVEAVLKEWRRPILSGTLTVPHGHGNLGAPGTAVLNGRDFLFLHLAEVGGERRYVAAHMSLQAD